MLLFVSVILVLIITLICGIELLLAYQQEENITPKCIHKIKFILAGIGFFILLDLSLRPQAIDVYKGKTTLEITYKDNIPMDSTVVFNSK